MITLYVSEEVMPGYTPLEVVNYSRLNGLYY